MKWIIKIGLSLMALAAAANAGYSLGWETRDNQGQCLRATAEREANARRIDAALRGFIDDDRH